MTVIDMQTMRYLNLLDQVSHVKTSKCFSHNNTVFFAVNRRDVSRAIGPGAVNVKKIQNSIGMKIRIIKEVKGVEEAKEFIESIVSPVKIKSIEIKDSQIIITAGNNQNKASLIGRNRRREEELQRIVSDFFGLGVRII